MFNRFTFFCLTSMCIIPSAMARDLTRAERATLAPLLSRNLRVAESAQLRFTHIVGDLQNGVAAICGEVNVGNPFGAHQGFQPFVASLIMRDGRAVEAFVQQTGDYDSTSGQAAQMACQQKGLNPRRAR